MNGRPSAIELLEKPDGFLTTSDLRDLGLPRGAVESIFRELPNVVVPGYRRPMVRVADFLAFIDASTTVPTTFRSRRTVEPTPPAALGRPPREQP